MPSNHLIPCHPLLLLPSVFPSIRIFPNESALHIRWPKYWSFSFSISLSNEYLGLISFRIDQLGLSRVLSRTTIRKRHYFGLSFLYGPTLTSTHDYWKNHSFDYTDLYWQSNVSDFKYYAVQVGHNFSSKEQVSFNFMGAVTICSDFGAQKSKVFHCLNIVSPSISHEEMGPDAMILVF